MTKFLKSVFNSVIFNKVILAVTFVSCIPILIKTLCSNKTTSIKYSRFFVIIALVWTFFLFNYTFLMIKSRTYLTSFTYITFYIVMVFISVLTAFVLPLYFIPDPEMFSNYSLVSFYYLVWVWCVYLNFCIRVLNSINVKCSVFVATTVKAILIAIVAWLALYKDSGIDKNRIISFTASYISLCYPIIDMYKYVRLELDRYIEDNNNPIQIKSYSD
ncbi:hypothetical protein [Lactobacillus apis]|uniref:hypothetical protein n=1 Tax=Lactobacillus apis TaxID=303541 RepID=UPI00242D796C|nr:hypothetical protein [Lactobacillus apis]